MLLDGGALAGTGDRHGQTPFPADFFRQEAVKVALGSLTSGIAGMTAGSVLAIRRNVPFTVPVLTTSIKSFGFGLGFFGLRQLVVHPLAMRSGFRSVECRPDSKLDGIFSTLLSSGILAGSVNGYMRGKQVVFRGALTISLICSTAHFTLNLLTSALRPLLASPSSHHPDSSSPSSRLLQPLWWERLIPLKKLSNVEFKEHLLKQLSSLNSQISELDSHISQLQKHMDLRENRTAGTLNTQASDT